MAQFHKANTDTPVQRFIKRMLKKWADDKIPPGYEGYVALDTHGAIDSEGYGDPARDEKPDFIKEANKGWESLNG